MCTVSFIPGKDNFYLTSNRDEKQWRKPALMPQLHLFQNCEMIFPKDGDAGGTWITLCGNGNAGVLLNGAFKNHIKKEKYRKSRGLIFLEIMDNENPVQNFKRHLLKGIEPFTMIIWQGSCLYECRWDEQENKHCCPLSVQRPYIWSSSTLYTEATRIKRKTWFTDWLKKSSSPEQQHVIDFHRFAGEGNKETDLMMNRDGQVSTVSVTSVALNRFKGSIFYTDVATGYESTSELFFNISCYAEFPSSATFY
jgi:uncharacterized protein with NRDE domain